MLYAFIVHCTIRKAFTRSMADCYCICALLGEANDNRNYRRANPQRIRNSGNHCGKAKTQFRQFADDRAFHDPLSPPDHLCPARADCSSGVYTCHPLWPASDYRRRLYQKWRRPSAVFLSAVGHRRHYRRFNGISVLFRQLAWRTRGGRYPRSRAAKFVTTGPALF